MVPFVIVSDKKTNSSVNATRYAIAIVGNLTLQGPMHYGSIHHILSSASVELQFVVYLGHAIQRQNVKQGVVVSLLSRIINHDPRPSRRDLHLELSALKTPEIRERLREIKSEVCGDMDFMELSFSRQLRTAVGHLRGNRRTLTASVCVEILEQRKLGELACGNGKELTNP